MDRKPFSPEEPLLTGERAAALATALAFLLAHAALPGPARLTLGALLGLAALVGLIWWPESLPNVGVGRQVRVTPGCVRAGAWFLLGSGTLVTAAVALVHALRG